jgi:hypothetical protein
MENQAISAKVSNNNLTYKKNGQPIPFVNEAKYVGMNLNVRLKWKAHIKKKKDEHDNKQ